MSAAKPPNIPAQPSPIQEILASLQSAAPPILTNPIPATAAVPIISRSKATEELVKEYIMTNSLAPGDPLPAEQELCRALGVSRSSVREALRRLEALDIISVQQGRGSFVGQMSMAPLVSALAFRASLPGKGHFTTLQEVVTVRRLLDLGIAEQVVAALHKTKQKQLEDIVEAMITKAQGGYTFLEEDFAFHDFLLAATGNTVMRQLVNSLWEVHTTVVPQLGLAVFDGLEKTARAHGQMLRAAQAGDVAAYRQAVGAHYQPVQDILVKHLGQMPGPNNPQ